MIKVKDTKLISNQYWLGYLATLINVVTLLVFNIIIPRVIGLEKFAMISLGYSIVYFGILLLEDGFNIEIIVNKQQQWKTIIKVKMICAIVIFFIISVALDWILLYLKIKPVYLWPLHFFVLNIILIPFVSVISSYFVAINKIEKVIFINISFGFITITIPLLCFLWTDSGLLVINGVTISYLVMSIICAILFLKNAVWMQSNKASSTSLLFKSIDQSSSGLINLYFNCGVFILLTKYFGTDIAVYNRIAYSICNAVCLILPVVTLNLHRLINLEDRTSFDYYKRILYIVAILSILGSIAIYCGVARIIGYLLGRNFAESIKHIRYLSFIVVFKAVIDVLRPVVLMRFGRIYILISTIISILSVLVILWLKSEYQFVKVYHLYYAVYIVLLLFFTLPFCVQRMRKLSAAT